MVDPLCVSTVCEVLTLNSPPVTHVVHVAERRLTGRLTRAVSYEITDEIVQAASYRFPVDFFLPLVDAALTALGELFHILDKHKKLFWIFV